MAAGWVLPSVCTQPGPTARGFGCSPKEATQEYASSMFGRWPRSIRTSLSSRQFAGWWGSENWRRDGRSRWRGVLSCRCNVTCVWDSQTGGPTAYGQLGVEGVQIGRSPPGTRGWGIPLPTPLRQPQGERKGTKNPALLTHPPSLKVSFWGLPPDPRQRGFPSGLPCTQDKRTPSYPVSQVSKTWPLRTSTCPSGHS